jgi:nucleoside-diphosphate-sugar epimerase
LILASSSEVYQFPPVIPTPENVPLLIPDPFNPRYSYAAAKITSEMMVIHYGRRHFERVVVFRPHNVYGPGMGWEHVVPQFVIRMKKLVRETTDDPIQFPVQSDGRETRSFVFIDDFTDGLMLVLERGEHLGIYNIGAMEEIAIADVARLVGEYFGRRVEIAPGEPAKGGTPRRCPDLSKLVALGYQPRYSFGEGLALVARWYDQNAHKKPEQWDWFPSITSQAKYSWAEPE